MARRKSEDEPYRVTDAELAVLRVLWNSEPATIRQITDALYPEGSSSEYGTVQKLLERLESKGCVERDRTGYAHQFRSVVDRSELTDDGLQALAKKLWDGSLAPVLMHLVKDRKLSRADRDELRALLSAHDPEASTDESPSTGSSSRGGEVGR